MFEILSTFPSGHDKDVFRREESVLSDKKRGIRTITLIKLRGNSRRKKYLLYVTGLFSHPDYSLFFDILLFSSKIEKHQLLIISAIQSNKTSFIKIIKR